jgi:hypothetical protein
MMGLPVVFWYDTPIDLAGFCHVWPTPIGGGSLLTIAALSLAGDMLASVVEVPVFQSDCDALPIADGMLGVPDRSL